MAKVTEEKVPKGIFLNVFVKGKYSPNSVDSRASAYWKESDEVHGGARHNGTFY